MKKWLRRVCIAILIGFLIVQAYGLFAVHGWIGVFTLLLFISAVAGAMLL